MMAIEVGKANEASEFFEIFGNGPVDDCFHFDRVHGNFSVPDNEMEILNLRLFKLVLFRSKIEIVFF